METEHFREAVSDMILLGTSLEVPPGSDELWTNPRGRAECKNYRLTWGYHQGMPAAVVWTTHRERAWAYVISERSLQRLSALAPHPPTWEQGRAQPTVPLNPPPKFPWATLTQLLEQEIQKGTQPEQLARLVAQTLVASGTIKLEL